MGPEWNVQEMVGLFDLMVEISVLSPATIISHTGNHCEPGDLLINAFHSWVSANNSHK